MAYLIRRTDAFVQDVEEVFEYIFLSLKSPQAASALLDSLESAYRAIEETL